MRVVVPSIKETVPVGVPPAAPETVITKLTDWLNTLGFGLAVTVVVVAAWLMVWDKTLEVLAVVLASPLYAAVTECEPAPRVETESWPELFVRLTVPRSVVASENETLPPAVPPKAGCTETPTARRCLKLSPCLETWSHQRMSPFQSRIHQKAAECSRLE